MTGFSADVKAAAAVRAMGRCEVHTDWCTGTGQDYHHRANRGMGGSKDPQINALSNCLLVCRDCHDVIGRNPAQAYAKGWLVSKFRQPSSEVAVLLRGRWVLLDDAGGIEVCDAVG